VTRYLTSPSLLNVSLVAGVRGVEAYTKTSLFGSTIAVDRPPTAKTPPLDCGYVELLFHMDKGNVAHERSGKGDNVLCNLSDDQLGIFGMLRRFSDSSVV
jgi:hypothetical protein